MEHSKSTNLSENHDFHDLETPSVLLQLTETETEVDETVYNFHDVNIEYDNGNGVENVEESGYSTPYYDTDEYGEFVSDDDEKIDDATRIKSTYPIYRSRKGYPVIEIGMKLKNAGEFKECVSLVAVYSKRAIVWVKNAKDQVRAKCRADGCPWMIFASYNGVDRSFQVKSYHDVPNCNIILTNPCMSQKLLAMYITDKLRLDLYMKDGDIVLQINHDYRTNVNISMVRRVKKQVRENIIANSKVEFGELWNYAAAIRLVNPGSTVKMIVQIKHPESPLVFQRYYMCIAALKNGFLRGCKKYIGLDGCFLKTMTKDELLCTIGRDGNNQMFPVAWALNFVIIITGNWF